MTGLARGIAFQLKENFGVLKREVIADDLKSLDQNARAQLRKYGVRFGAFNIHFPQLLKPAPAELTLALWTLKSGVAAGLNPDALPEPPRPGLTSAPADSSVPEAFYRAAGYHVCGPRAIRYDMLERLADLIRPLLAWRQSRDPEAKPPAGSTGDGGFTTTPEMMSILGCSPDELGKVLKALGFRLDRRLIKAEAPAPAAAATEVPAEVPAIDAPAEGMAVVEAEALPAADVVASAPDDPAAGSGAENPAETAAAPAPVEEKYEEIWRPRRHHRNDAADAGERAASQHRRRERRGGGRSQRGPDNRTGAPAPVGEGAASVGAAGETTPSAERPAHARPPRRDGHRDKDRARGGAPSSGPRGRDAQGPGKGAPEGRPGEAKSGRDRQRDSHRERQGRDQRGGEGRGGEHRRGEDRGAPRAITAAPPRKSGAADADSPFASLMALREALEQASRDKGST